VALGIWTADCVPVLLAAGTAVAAVHAGWRGAAAEIVPKAVQLIGEISCLNSSSVQVCLGPAVGPCHYQVGDEVVEALRTSGVAERHWLENDRVDLRAFIKGQLIGLGVIPDEIETVGRCTACSPQHASFRRDRELAGRQLSFIVRCGSTDPLS
jgi:YfiH family protein